MKKVLYLGFIFILLSCSNNEKYENCSLFSYDSLSTDKIVDLKGNIVNFNVEVRNPVRAFCANSILFLTNRNTATFLDKYDLKTYEKIGSCISFGSGPNELQIISSILKTDSTVWLFDQIQQKLFEYSLDDFCWANTPIPYNTITLEEAANNILILPENKIISTTFNTEEKRLSFFNMQGALLEHKGEFPYFGKELTTIEKIESFMSQMLLSPDKTKILLSYKQTDLIEIYSTDGVLKKRIQGPDFFFPSIQQYGDNENIKVKPANNKSRDAYFFPTVYKDEIWILYSGLFFDPQEASNYLNNTILVFDWEGNFIRKYNLDVPIFTFTIDEYRNKIYGITDNPEMQIIEFSF